MFHFFVLSVELPSWYVRSSHSALSYVVRVRRNCAPHCRPAIAYLRLLLGLDVLFVTRDRLFLPSTAIPIVPRPFLTKSSTELFPLVAQPSFLETKVDARSETKVDARSETTTTITILPSVHFQSPPTFSALAVEQAYAKEKLSHPLSCGCSNCILCPYCHHNKSSRSGEHLLHATAVSLESFRFIL